MIRLLRSTFFNLFFYGLTTIMVLALPLVTRRGTPAMQAYIRLWARLVLSALRRFCGISWRVVGAAHLPAGPALIA